MHWWWRDAFILDMKDKNSAHCKARRAFTPRKKGKTKSIVVVLWCFCCAVVLLFVPFLANQKQRSQAQLAVVVGKNRVLVATTRVDRERRRRSTARVRSWLMKNSRKPRWFFSWVARRVFFGQLGFSVGSPLLYIDTKNKKRPRFFFAETKQRHRQPTSPLNPANNGAI